MESQKTILVVDDEPDLREILASEFELEGYRVLEAANGQAAFDLIQKDKSVRVDLVLTDVQMPEWDGVRLLTELRKNHPDIPVVMFLTGYSKISVEEAYDQGAVALFEKPYDRAALISAVKRVLDPGSLPTNGRLHSRVEVPLEANITYSGETSFDQAGLVTNVAKGGAFVATSGDLPRVGEQVKFKIQVHSSNSFQVQGTGVVRWVRTKESLDFPIGYGIEFTALDQSSRTHFFELLNSLKTLAYIPRK